MTPRQFYNASRGDRFIYAIGDFSDNIGLTVAGMFAMSLYEKGRAALVQNKVGDKYEYIVVKLK